MTAEKVYDCIIIGAGPGGLQAAIHLGRFNRDVLLIDRGGGRTGHTRQIENFLSRKSVSGREIIELGIEQAKSFNVQIEKGLVTRVLKKTSFEVHRGDTVDFSRFVIVSSGVYDNFPDIENLHSFLGTGLFTCVDCDGYRTTGKSLVVLGNSIETVHLAFAMKEMYTERITVVLIFYDPPEAYKEELSDEGITLVKGRPTRIIGDEKIEALELKDGRQIPCEVIMSNFGYKLNNEFLSELDLKRDGKGFKYVVSHVYESSTSGLYVVGPLNQGGDQVIVAAGQGAVAAIDIKKRLFNS